VKRRSIAPPQPAQMPAKSSNRHRSLRRARTRQNSEVMLVGVFEPDGSSPDAWVNGDASVALSLMRRRALVAGVAGGRGGTGQSRSSSLELSRHLPPFIHAQRGSLGIRRRRVCEPFPTSTKVEAEGSSASTDHLACFA
jgi:hypothetical protein